MMKWFFACGVGLGMLAATSRPAIASDDDRRHAPAVTISGDAMSGAVTLVPLALTRPVAPLTIDRTESPGPSRAAARGVLLSSLYLSLAGLNAFDAYTTTAGLSRGALEANPVMRPFAGHPVAVWAVKGGVTAGSVYVAERLWKKHRKVDAVVVMAISNGLMAVVAARNAAVLRALPR